MRLWQRVWLWLLLLWLLPMIFIVLLSRPGMAQAAHDPQHNCPSWVAQQVLSGGMGGSFYGSPSVVTWTDGAYVCIFQGGQATTFFKSRNALAYLAKDAVRKGLQKITPQTARYYVEAAKTGGRAIMNAPVIIAPTGAWCQIYPQMCRRTVNQ